MILKEDREYEYKGHKFKFFAEVNTSFPKEAIAEIEFVDSPELPIESVSYTFLTGSYDYTNPDCDICKSLTYNVGSGYWELEV